MDCKDFKRIEIIAEHLKTQADELHSGIYLECYKKAINDFLELIKQN